MPGEFYVENKQQKVDLTEIKNIISQVQNNLNQLQTSIITQVQNSLNQLQTNITQVQNNITTLVTKSEGLTPVTGSTSADWQTSESDVVIVGAAGASYKVHSLLLGIQNLVGTVITVRMYVTVNGAERKVYEQSFSASVDPSGLWVINGTVGIHEALRVTLQSNDAGDNGKAADYDCMMEAM